MRWSLLLFSTSVGAFTLSPLKAGSTVAIITPMLLSNVPASVHERNKCIEKSTLDIVGYNRLLDFHKSSNTDGLCVLGTTGEAAQLSMEERAVIISETVKSCKNHIPFMVGTGTSCPAQTYELTKQAYELGADAALVVTPMYIKPTQKGLINHFTELATALPDMPIVLYNVPSRTGVDMSPETIGILSKIPSIVGVKEATGDVSRVKKLRAVCRDNFLLWSGDDGTGAEFVLEGGDGVVSVTSNVCPKTQHEIMKAALAKDRETVEKLNKPLLKLHDELFCQSNPIVPKWALWRMGMVGKGIRKPLTVMEEQFVGQVEGAMKEAGITLCDNIHSADCVAE